MSGGWREYKKKEKKQKDKYTKWQMWRLNKVYWELIGHVEKEKPSRQRTQGTGGLRRARASEVSGAAPA